MEEQYKLASVNFQKASALFLDSRRISNESPFQENAWRCLLDEVERGTMKLASIPEERKLDGRRRYTCQTRTAILQKIRCAT